MDRFCQLHNIFLIGFIHRLPKDDRATERSSLVLSHLASDLVENIGLKEIAVLIGHLSGSVGLVSNVFITLFLLRQLRFILIFSSFDAFGLALLAPPAPTPDPAIQDNEGE